MMIKNLGTVVSALGVAGSLLFGGSALASPAVPGAAPAQPHQINGLCQGGATGFFAKWGPVYDSCEYTSPPHGGKGYITVKWTALHGLACVEAREAKAKNPDKWQSLSCGKFGQGKVRWPKNTASKLEVRVKSEQAPVESVQYSF